MATLALSLCSLLCVGSAQAGRPAMEPQVRVHAGASIVASPSPVGLSLGVDSRVGRNLALDAGIYVSPFGELETTSERATARDHFRTRHALYSMPGLRIPHPQPRAFRWDVYVRGGPGVVWTTDIWDRATSSTEQMDVAMFAGVDGVIMVGSWGFRASAKGVFTGVYDNQLRNDVFFGAPQFAAELVYQFGVAS